MGNSNNHHGDSSHSHGHTRKSSTSNPAAIKCFSQLSEGRPSLTESDFMRVFGEKIGPLLLKDIFSSAEVNEAEFSRHFYDFADIRSDECTKMFSSVEEFLDACLSTAGKDLKSEDKDFVSKFVEDVNKEGSVRFFNSNCPSLAQNTIVRHIRNVFNPSSEQVIFAVDSAVLSPLQMILLQGSLPEMVYFKHKQSSNPCWSKLYESHSQGLSVNRFESNVFGYSSPSVALFKLNDRRVFSISTNVEWRHTTKFLGSNLSKCIQFEPSFKFIESRHEEPIICNFKFRTAPFGLGVRDVFTINGEFGNVEAIEVWGCGNETSAQEQKSLKQRQQTQAERNQKVPLPGQWDQDKAVLEMAGFSFSNEREHRPEPPIDD